MPTAKKSSSKKGKQPAFDPDQVIVGRRFKTPKSGKGSRKYKTDEEAKKELEELEERFKQVKEMDAKAERQYWDALDSEFWFTLCFQSREQKDEFLRLTKLDDIGNKFLDGMKAAVILGVELKTEVPPIRRHKKIEQKLSDLALEL